MRWKSSLGFKTVERLLNDLDLKFVSDMTESEWMASSVHAHSKIELMCIVCDSRCSPTLNNLFRNRSVACLCNGSARSDRSVMYTRLICQLNSKNMRLVNIDSYESYTALSPTTRTKLDVECTICGIRGSPMIGSILCQKSGIRCKCNGGVLYASEAKYTELLNKLSKKSLRLNDISTPLEWIQLSPVSTTRIRVSCSHCGDMTTYPCNALFGKSTIRTLCGCVDTSHLPTGSLGKYKLVLEQVRASRFVFAEEEPTFSEWKTMASACNVKVDLRCTLCNQLTSPSAEKLLIGTVGCGCNNSSEARVFAFVKDVLNCIGTGLRTEREWRSSITGCGGGQLRYDVAVLDALSNIVLVVEIDGGHHFGGGHSDLKRKSGQLDWTIQHDLMKEWKVIESGATMLRIEARTVETNQMSWNAWIQQRLIDSITRKTPPGIHRLASGSQYASEVYASPRSGTVLATESDSTLHPSPLPFPEKLQ